MSFWLFLRSFRGALRLRTTSPRPCAPLNNHKNSSKIPRLLI
nr:MAG TPA: hypothetical protein [Caudoviricetes sp.]